jgi:PTH1 family peptidyl-tRNA hydrolase
MFWRKKESNDNPPFLIVGLGNPGPDFEMNRHNVGFLVLDELANQMETTFSRMQANALVAQGRRGETRVVLAKPRTFMNRSGSAVGGLARFYKVPFEKLLIVYDDVDLPFDTLRMRAEGSSGGHNGMKSIIASLGSQDFARLRVGVGRPKGRMRTPDHVLQDFSRAEQQELPFVVGRAKDAALAYIEKGVAAAMNEFNVKGDRE